MKCKLCVPRFMRQHQFQSPDFEKAFVIQQRPAVVKFSVLWCIVQIVLTLSSAGTGVLIFGLTSHGLALFGYQAAVIIALVTLALVVKFVSSIQQYASKMLCCACMLLIGWTGWMIHTLVQGLVVQAQDGPLKQIWAMALENLEAKEDFERYLYKETSGKMLLLYLLFNFFLLDLVRFMGCIRTTALTCLTLPLVYCVTIFASPVVSNDVAEMLAASIGLAIYAFFSSLHIVGLQRQQFELDHQLQAMLQNEAKVLKAAQDAEMFQKEANRKADSVLHHNLKNLMADAVGCIDLSFDCAGAQAREYLNRALACLERGMEWCHQRHIMQALTLGTYEPEYAPTNLKAFGEEIIKGRLVTGEFPNEVVQVDATLCKIVADNAVTNGIRHGDPANPEVQFSIEMRDEVSSDGSSSKWMVMQVTNRVSPDRPALTKEFITEIVTGEVEHQAVVPALAHQLGLRNLFLAAKAHKMDVMLGQDGDWVTFVGAVLISNTPSNQSLCTEPGEAEGPRFPPGFRILCVEDSDVARRLLEHILKKNFPDAEIQAFGKTAEEVEDFMKEARKGAEILIFDQHLQYERELFLGTDLIHTLLQEGNLGFMCIRSANVDQQDITKYLASGAHYVIGKDVRAAEMAEVLQKAYRRHVRKKKRSFSIPKSEGMISIAPEPRQSILLETSGINECNISLELQSSKDAEALLTFPGEGIGSHNSCNRIREQYTVKSDLSFTASFAGSSQSPLFPARSQSSGFYPTDPCPPAPGQNDRPCFLPVLPNAAWFPNSPSNWLSAREGEFLGP